MSYQAEQRRKRAAMRAEAQAVYDCERDTFAPWFERYITVKEARELIYALCKHFEYSVEKLKVRRNNDMCKAGVYYSQFILGRGWREHAAIIMLMPAVTIGTAIHEFAHHLTHKQYLFATPHGKEFEERLTDAFAAAEELGLLVPYEDRTSRKEVLMNEIR